MDYDRALIGLICSKLSDADTHQLLEVAIGTGEPIARSLVKLGHNLTAIDISSLLIEKCKRINPEIQCEVGDAEELSFTSAVFDLSYCFHSSWCMPNFPKAISEMVRVTKARGKIVFDVMNIHNEEINRIYRLHIFENKNPVGMIYKFFKNVIKFILRRGAPDWSILVFQTPSDPHCCI